MDWVDTKNRARDIFGKNAQCQIGADRFYAKYFGWIRDRCQWFNVGKGR